MKIKLDQGKADYIIYFTDRRNFRRDSIGRARSVLSIGRSVKPQFPFRRINHNPKPLHKIHPQQPTRKRITRQIQCHNGKILYPLTQATKPGKPHNWNLHQTTRSRSVIPQFPIGKEEPQPPMTPPIALANRA
jgi:hypothetical protein